MPGENDANTDCLRGEKREWEEKKGKNKSKMTSMELSSVTENRQHELQ